MKKTLLALAAVVMLAGCTTAERSATIGAAAGGAIGAATSGTIGGAAIGAFIGGAGGYLLGRAADRGDGWCEYRDSRGRIFYDRCPGY
ncbi:MAG: glycine zipper domain-containing protein [Rhizobiaceae bacterium]